jgi:hypothetical protein
MRAWPLLTGLAALVCFARLAWLALPPLAATGAVGVLAATHYVTRYSLDIKPYGTDLLMASGLLLLAVHWMRAPQERRWPVLLSLAAPVALLFSYPAVFVAGAVPLALVPVLWRRRSGFGGWALLGLYTAVVGLSFAGIFALSGRAQYEATHRDLLAYWAAGFPPADPLRLVVWLLDVHTAEMMSYPLGGKNGASTLTLLLCLLGVRELFRTGRTDLLRLLGSIFALTLLAAALRAYPYGGSARVAQHLAPAICLFVGAALERIVRAFAPGRRPRAATAVAVTLLLLVLGGMARDMLHPYHTKRHQELRALMSVWTRERRADSGVWLVSPFEDMPLTVQWYLLRGVGEDRRRLGRGPAAPEVLAGRGEWWLFNCDPRLEGNAALPPRPQLAAAGYVLRSTSRLLLSESGRRIPDEILEVERWSRPS